MSVISANRFDELRSTNRLPSPTGVGLKIVRLTQDESATASDLAGVIQSDPALSGRLLKLANSARYASNRSIGALEDAVVRLGQDQVRSVALGFSMLSGHRSGQCVSFDYDFYWAHCLAVAVASQLVSPLTRLITPVEGYTCALLSQIGRLALAAVYPRDYADILELVRQSDPRILRDLEYENFATDHNELSAAMLEDWGLPQVWAVGVLHHEFPAQNKLGLTDRGTLLAYQLHLSRSLADACINGCDRLTREMIEDALVLQIDETELPEVLARLRADWIEAATALSLSTESSSPHMYESDTSETSEVLSELSKGEQNGPEFQQIRALVVDDDPTNRFVVEHLLSKMGFHIVACSDGQDGLEQTLKLNPHLVITDWDMPVMNGPDFCRALRRTEFGHQVHILMLTSREHEDHIAEAFDAGADDFVSKPFHAKTLQARVNAGVRKVRHQQQQALEKERLERHVAELALTNRQFQKYATKDTATGLLNRLAFKQRLTEEMEEARRCNRSLACLLVDISDFGRMDDGFGRAVGDRSIRSIADCIRAAVRKYDVVGRSGDAEFTILCPEADSKRAWKIAQRVHSAVSANELVIRAQALMVGSVSVGIGMMGESTERAEDLLQVAKLALRGAKEIGPNETHLCAVPPSSNQGCSAMASNRH